MTTNHDRALSRYETLADHFSAYLLATQPPQAGPVQILEVQRAFYAGARAMFGLMAMPPTAHTAQTGERQDALEDELDAFAQQLREGKA